MRKQHGNNNKKRQQKEYDVQPSGKRQRREAVDQPFSGTTKHL